MQELALLDREAYLICRNAHLTEDLQSSQAVHRHASKRDAVPTRHDADPLGESFSLRPQECTYVCMYIMCVCIVYDSLVLLGSYSWFQGGFRQVCPGQC